MTIDKQLDRTTIQTAIDELEQISRDEYNCGLEDLLLDRSPQGALRLQRIVGIVLKRPFAREAPPAPFSVTGARRSWPWTAETPESRSADAPKEFALLDQLRGPGPWHEQTPSTEISWEQLKEDVEHERGLFKILVLYIDDKLKKQGPRTFQEYLDAKETRRFEAGLDLATLLFDAAVTGPLSALLGIPALAVGVALVGTQYGYRRMTDPNSERTGDIRA